MDSKVKADMKILIVDDEDVSLKKMEMLVQHLGYETLTAKDGQEAWQLWQREQVRMVITDWLMPNMDGLTLCKKIRQSEGSLYTYLVIVTSKNELRDIVEGMEAGADDFIEKPFRKEEISVRIRAGERILGFGIRDVVIFSLAKLVESRDPETGNHLERIRFYSKTIAETIAQSNISQEVNSRFVNNIFLASPLHDIGKVGIPDYILLKPGPFNEKEFELMKKHSSIGFETLNEALIKYPWADFLKMSAEIACSHHEKYDGSGYPNGLKAEQIPLSARIVALADVYDALVSRRVYKKAYAPDVAKAIIQQDRGKHFDPLIVDTFLLCEKQFIDIYNRFKD